MRTHEFGLRVALGAQKMDVAILVLKWGGRLALLGAGLGLLLACWLTRLLVGLLEGVNALDPITYAAVAVLLLGAALLASYLPARRATAVDPIVALRYE
jgi:ABC-type antimicrobial peptide transport system permease subunit